MLLFKTRKTASRLVRSFTNSEFDHAAMVLRYASSPSVYFLHATSNLGIHLTNFDDFKAQIGD